MPKQGHDRLRRPRVRMRSTPNERYDRRSCLAHNPEERRHVLNNRTTRQLEIGFSLTARRKLIRPLSCRRLANRSRRGRLDRSPLPPQLRQCNRQKRNANNARNASRHYREDRPGQRRDRPSLKVAQPRSRRHHHRLECAHPAA